MRNCEIESGLGTEPVLVPSTAKLLPAVLPFTLTFELRLPNRPALLTSPAAPAALESTCVKLRPVSGTAVMVLLSTSVPVEEDVVCAMVHRQGDGSPAPPGSNRASTTVFSET